MSELRKLSKTMSFAHDYGAALPRLAFVRRMDCGKWRAAGKVYRTKTLAEQGAVKRGFVPISAQATVHSRSWGAWRPLDAGVGIEPLLASG